MIVWRIIRKEFAKTPLSTAGAKAWPGRWHSAGTAVLYTASSESLAILETFVHLALEYRTIPHVRLRIGLPDDAVVDDYWRLVGPGHAQSDWAGEDTTATRAVGDSWASAPASGLCLRVPSILSGSEHNILLREQSPQFAEIKVLDADEFRYDDRLWKAPKWPEGRAAGERPA